MSESPPRAAKWFLEQRLPTPFLNLETSIRWSRNDSRPLLFLLFSQSGLVAHNRKSYSSIGGSTRRGRRETNRPATRREIVPDIFSSKQLER